MELGNLVENQKTTYDAINRLLINLKKDSSERKSSPDYFKRKLVTLENLWSEFQNNHIQLCQYEEIKEHPYILNSEYELANRLYEVTKTYIVEGKKAIEYQVEAGTSGLRPQPTSRISSPQIQSPVVTEKGKVVEPAPLQPTTQQEQQPTDQSRFSTKQAANRLKLMELIKKQTVNFKAFTRTVNNIDIENFNEKWEFEYSLKTLQSRWSTIDALHWEIEGNLEEQDDIYQELFSRHESTFNSMIKALNCKLWSAAHRQQTTPQMDIPVFSGSYQHWVSFKDLFTETIHSNPSLSGAQKMQYLKSKVKGEPETLIRHLPISTDNYIICWDILNNRYNNKKAIFSTYMNLLMGLPTMQQQSYNLVKKMHDTVTEALNGIKNLEIDISTWDPIVVHILQQKLDSETLSNYVESVSNPKDLPSLHEFMNFLEHKFTNLESSRRKQENNLPKTHLMNLGQHNIQAKKQNYSHSIDSKPKAMHISTNIKCPLCYNNHQFCHCDTFLQMGPDMKLKTVSKLKLCKNCLFQHKNKCYSIKRCRSCSGYHNSLLHDAYVKHNSSQPSTSTGASTNQDNVIGTSHVSVNEASEIILATANLKITAADGSQHVMRALIDQGSQISIITEHAAQLLKLKRRKCNGSIFGVGEKQNQCKGLINITGQSMYSDFKFETDALIMNSLVKKLPNQTLSKPTWQYIESLQLADPEFYVSRPIDLLLGADVYANIMLGGIIRGQEQTQPIAQQTYLGWILCGPILKTFHCNVVINNLEDIKSFWEIESITESSDMSADDLHCLEFYNNTTKRREDGRYEVKLPMKTSFEEHLGKSEHLAIAQFKALEKRFHKQQQLAQQYVAFMKEYEDLGHMKLHQLYTDSTCYFLPHHGVERKEATTTKLRVVFNASSKTTTGNSLNDLMFKGPNLQKDLQSLMINWRTYQYAFTADIEKMFRCIYVDSDDQQLQNIVWRESPNEQLQAYQLTTVTYGTKAAPFLAMMTLKRLAQDERNRFPRASKILENQFYMDDLCGGCFSEQEAMELVVELLKLGGFILRKWSSNSKQILEKLDYKQTAELFNFKSDFTTKTLGIGWNPVEDKFKFRYQTSECTNKLTKRALLSEISRIFDPLGWLAPVVVKLKLLFQRVWALDNLAWDDELPEALITEWSQMKEDLKNISNFVVPRWIGSTNTDTIELHGFCDASTKAIACVVYARNSANNTITIVAAKTKLVPLSKTNKISLPRLELSAAELLSQLIAKITNSLGEINVKVFGWTDSMVVLGWLQGDPGRWKTYVSNRVQKITNILPSCYWRYINTNENPADSASRGLYVSQLMQLPLWWKGPERLVKHQNYKQDIKQITTSEELRNINVNVVQSADTYQNIVADLLAKSNSITKAKRILAWVLRATKLLFTNNTSQRPGHLTPEELETSMHLIIMNEQRHAFENDITYFKKHKHFHCKSKILNLNPVFDKSGILRVGGRLKKANLDPNMKHPAIIPHEGRLTYLLIQEAHLKSMHGGAKLTLSYLRKNFWTIKGISTTKKQLKQCVTCKKHEPQKHTQLMGDLPEYRVVEAPPFYHTGVDYTGFVEVKSSKGRGIRTSKGYVVVFICMVTKSVHLELASDLSSSAFLAALRRMSARRGAPANMYSDNGTNFVKANRTIQEEIEQMSEIFKDTYLQSEIAEMNIKWHFNAPTWASAGGLWERAVRSMKHHLKRVIGTQKLTFEEFSTLLAQIEACLNSRPLCALSEDIEDLETLTPAHFLTGRAGLTIIANQEDARTRWEMIRKINEDLWKRWKSEYLTQITIRNKWLKAENNIKIGDIAIIHDNSLPGKWPMGRVIDAHPGSDGLVRVVSLKTKNGVIKRPITKISVLPIADLSKSPNSCLGKHKVQHQPEPNSNSATQQPSKKNKSIFSVSSLLFTLITLLCTFTPARASFNITNLDRNQSIYFDPISKMQLIRDKWTLIVYHDMSPYWQGDTAYNKILKYLTKTCDVNKNGCDMILLQLEHEYNELKYYNQLLLTQQYVGEARRLKRGLINGVSYIANSLFGVLDERFAEQYTHDIDLIRNNQHRLSNLWRNQTNIIESEFNLLKRTEQVFEKQHKLINSRLNYLEKATNDAARNMQAMSESTDFLMSAFMASNLLRTLKQIQEALLDTLTDIYHGQFNIHLLTPKQLADELTNIMSHLSKDLSLPIGSTNTDLHDIYKLLKVKSRLTQNYLIFEITIPLVSRDNFELYRIISIPQQVDGFEMEAILLSDYIAINLRKDSYILITSYELQQCYEQHQHYLCQLQAPIYHLKTNEKLCIVNNHTGKCKVRKTICHDKWIAMNDPSSYLFSICHPYQHRIICNQEVSAEVIQGAGIIHLGSDCELKGHDITLYSHDHKFHKVNVETNIFIPTLSELNRIMNVTLPLHHDDTELSASLNNSIISLANDIKEMKAADAGEEELSQHDIHQYVVSYVAVACLAAGGAALLWLRCRPRRRHLVVSPEIRAMTDINSAVSCAVQNANSDRAQSVPPRHVKRKVFSIVENSV